MSYNYAPIKSVATSLIQRFGKSYNFTHKRLKSFEPDTGLQASAITNYAKHACKFEINSSDEFGTPVEIGDFRLLAEAYDYATGDTVRVGDSDCRIIAVKPIEPGDTKCAVNLLVRL